MKTEFRMMAVALAAVFAASAVTADVKAAKGRLDKVIGELTARTRLAGTAEIVKGIEDFAATDVDATNREVRAYADAKCLDYCSRRTERIGGRFGQFDEKVAAETTERIARRIFADPQATKGEKLQAADYYCASLANAERYAEAEKIAKDMIAVDCKDINTNARAWKLLMRVYRWWNKYDEALAAGREMCRVNPVFTESLVLMMNDFERYDEAFAVWKELRSEADEMRFYYNNTEGHRIYGDKRYHALLERRARAFIRDEKVAVEKRFQAASELGLLAPDTAEAAADRDVFRGCDFSEKRFENCNANFLAGIYINGNYAHFTRLVELYSGLRRPDLAAPRFRRAYVMSLAYQGRDREALAAIAKDRTAKGLKPVDSAMLDALEAVILKKDALPAIRKLDLPAKELVKAYLLPAQFALNLQRNDECRRYADEYRKLFGEIPRRRVDVPWFDEPVATVDDWRRIRPRLKETFVDVKMYGDLENLVTDVATGRGEVKLGEAEGKLAIEVTQLCDVNGLHIFMAVKDGDARLVEKGFSGGFGNEMYFAPGANQPYICFGIGPKAGLEYVFQTAYSSIDHTRLAQATSDRDSDALRCEVGFSDDDYVFHLTFPWKAFYQKLPVRPGTAWKFDCLCWGNGCSWGGSQGVHESSSWGDLVFNLTPAQATAIRRKILFDTFKGWNAAPEEWTCAPFDRWADDVVGDPEFYRQCLKPLEDELRGYVARVKPDMSDADVNEIYAKGVQRWMGLKYEIDLLRRNYLTLKNAK